MPADAMAIEDFDFEDLFKGLSPARSLFLRAFLDSSNTDTYMRPAGAARAAGYAPSAGSGLARALEAQIQIYLHQIGLGTRNLESKVAELLEAKETKLMQIAGRVEDWDLDEGARVIARSVERGGGPGGTDKHTTIIGIDQASLGLQHRALDTAIKLLVGYKPEKKEISGTGFDAFLAAIAGKSKDLLSD
jgi:hypothetical protein